MCASYTGVFVCTVYTHTLCLYLFISLSLSPLPPSQRLFRFAGVGSVLMFCRPGKTAVGAAAIALFVLLSYCVDCNMAAFSRLEGLSLRF